MFIVCPCGNKKEIQASRVGRKKYCSKGCFYKYRNRPSGLHYKVVVDNSAWFKRKDTVKPDGKGYIRRSSKGRSIREHKIILENKLGRKLNSDEVTHHLNGIKTDNRPENLVAMLKKEHDKLHNGRKFIQTA